MRWTRRKAALWLAIGLLIWIAATAVTLVDVRNHIETARAEVELVRQTPADALDLADVSTSARLIEHELQLADRKANAFYLTPLRRVPVVGRHLRVLQSVTGTANELSALGVGILEAVEAYLADDERSRGEILGSLEADLTLLDTALATADLGPRGHLVLALTEAQTEFESTITEAHDATTEALTIVRGLSAFAEDSDYLLLGANNSEMRLGAGMVLSIGELGVNDGEFSLDELRPTNQLFPVPDHPTAGSEPIDADVRARWGFLSPTNDYRKLTYTARFADFTGPQSLLMWEAQTGARADGVVLVDPFILDALVGVIGPVDVDGEKFTAGKTLEYLLRDQYARFGVDTADIAARQDKLSVIAAAVVQRFGEGGFDPVKVFQALRPLVAGRHLMIYSPDPVQQSAWKSLGLTGELSGDETGVYLLNVGASKLDPYIDVQIDVSVGDGPDPELRTVRYTATITNTVEDGLSLPDYTVGPWESVPLPEAGSYPARLVVYAPALATNLRFEPEQSLEAFGADGPVWVMSTLVLLTPGQELVTQIAYELPAEVTAVQVEPSARYPPVLWSTGRSDQDDSRRFVLELERP